MSTPPRIAIVGAGIVGSAIAYFLALRGVSVTLIDTDGPGTGVTGRAFGWINVALTDPDGPAALFKHRVIQDYRRLDDRLGGRLDIAWNGALSWDDAPSATEVRFRHLDGAGHVVRLVDGAEVARLEPALSNPPSCAIFAPEDGMMRPGLAARVLATAACEAGAVLRLGHPVEALDPLPGDGMRLRLAGEGLDFDRVVLAAGTAVTRLAAPLGLTLPVTPSPCILARFRTPGPMLNRIVETPGFEARCETPGRLVAAESYIDDSPENGPEAVSARLRSELAAGIRGGDRLVLDSVVVGVRPMPTGRGPIVGRAPDLPSLYIAAMHPGVILAATIGELAAQDILDGAVPNALRSLVP